jgi:hypothetical protein
VIVSAITEYADVTRNLVEVVSLVGAGGFFFVKWRGGYQIVDSSLTIATDRSRANGTEDYLAVVVTITKGPRGSARIHDAKVRVTWEGQSAGLVRPLVGIERLSYTTQAWKSKRTDIRSWGPGRRSITFRRESRTTPLLSMAPGDQSQLGSAMRVPSSVACIVEVVVLASRWSSHRVSQWRASGVSLPRPSQDEATGT